MSAAIFSAAFLTSQFFQFAAGDSPLGTRLRFLPWTATPLLVAPVAGAISDRVGARGLLVPGLVMQAAGSPGSCDWPAPLRATPATSFRSSWPGSGISMALPCVTAAGLNAASPALLGKARHPEHAAAVRRGIRRCDRHGRVQLRGQPGRSRRGDERVPSGPRGRGGPVGAGSGRGPPPARWRPAAGRAGRRTGRPAADQVPALGPVSDLLPGCPRWGRWDSNPHCQAPKACASANWATTPSCSLIYLQMSASANGSSDIEIGGSPFCYQASFR